MQEVADKLNVLLAKFSLAWCLKNPDPGSVILAAFKAEQLRENLTAPEVVPL